MSIARRVRRPQLSFEMYVLGYRVKCLDAMVIQLVGFFFKLFFYKCVRAFFGDYRDDRLSIYYVNLVWIN